MPEWCAFITIEFNDRSRIGTPSALLDMTWDLQLLLEEIAGVLAGEKVNPATRFTMNRLRIMDHRTQGYRPGFNFTKISSYVLS